jgi:hypothetical protein
MESKNESKKLDNKIVVYGYFFKKIKEKMIETSNRYPILRN